MDCREDLRPRRYRVCHTTGESPTYGIGRIAGGRVYGRNADGSAMPITIEYADGRAPRTIVQERQPVVSRADILALKARWSA